MSELMERDMGRDMVVYENNHSFSDILIGLNREQRNYLTFLAMKCESNDAMKLAKVRKEKKDKWMENSEFVSKELTVLENDFSTEALSIFLDTRMPFVLNSLVNICLSGEDGNRPSKDKEKAIEFYLKDLCGISKHVNKEMGFYKFLEERLEI